jgi:aminomethyltransferase
VTSGGPSPSTGKNVAIGYVAESSKKTGTPLQVEVRGKNRPAVVVKTPFVESGYRKVGK